MGFWKVTARVILDWCNIEITVMVENKVSYVIKRDIGIITYK